jgi:hypothetical protein
MLSGHRFVRKRCNARQLMTVLGPLRARIKSTNSFIFSFIQTHKRHKHVKGAKWHGVSHNSIKGMSFLTDDLLFTPVSSINDTI